jgi:hypothetical protein
MVPSYAVTGELRHTLRVQRVEGMHLWELGQMPRLHQVTRSQHVIFHWFCKLCTYQVTRDSSILILKLSEGFQAYPHMPATWFIVSKTIARTARSVQHVDQIIKNSAHAKQGYLRADRRGLQISWLSMRANLHQDIWRSSIKLTEFEASAVEKDTVSCRATGIGKIMVTSSHCRNQFISLSPSTHSVDASISIKDNMTIAWEKSPLPIDLAWLPLEWKKWTTTQYI